MSLKKSPYPFLLGQAALSYIWAESCIQLDRIQHRNPKVEALNQFMDNHLSPNVQNFIRYQGEDFITAPMGVVLGGGASLYALSLINKKKNSKVANFIERHHKISRSLVGYAQLGAYELYQSQTNNTPFDYKDMAVYAAGIAIFIHGSDIIKGFAQAAGEIVTSVTDLVSPITRNLKP